MAKESGLGHYLFVGGYDLSGDTGSVDTIRSSRVALDVTGIDKSAIERISGLTDGEISFKSWYNASAGQEHPALSTLPTTDRLVQYHAGATVGQNVACLNAKQIDYSGSRGADGSLAFTVQALSNGSPVEWGEMLTAGKETFASSGAGTHYDYTTASTAFGAVAYLQVFSLSGTSVTVAVQDSVDTTPGNFSNITGLAFSAVTPGAAPQAQRLATATTATIRRWVRVNLTGTFTNAVIAVGFIKFAAAQS